MNLGKSKRKARGALKTLSEFIKKAKAARSKHPTHRKKKRTSHKRRKGHAKKKRTTHRRRATRRDPAWYEKKTKRFEWFAPGHSKAAKKGARKKRRAKSPRRRGYLGRRRSAVGSWHVGHDPAWYETRVKRSESYSPKHSKAAKKGARKRKHAKSPRGRHPR